MNPGRRRLLIPGLLVVLLVIVAVVAAARRAEAQTKPDPVTPSTFVSVISDPRITESSGLAPSQKYPGIAYTFNDSGHAAQVFAIDIASGVTVGVTTVDGVIWRDAEAMALWRGKVWIGDVGTAMSARTDRAVYAFPEPGPGDHHVRAERYPVTFDSKKPVEIEAMAMLSDRVDFYAKGWQGVAYAVSGPLKRDMPNIARPTARTVPAWTTDATATPDGRLVLVRGTVVVEVRDAKTWQLRYSDVIPILRQGESIGLEASGKSYLIGSEREDSPLLRIAFHPDRIDVRARPLDSKAQAKAQHPLGGLIWEHQGALALGAILAPVGLIALTIGLTAWWSVHRRRKAVEHGN